MWARNFSAESWYKHTCTLSLFRLFRMMHDVTIFSLPNCILGRIDYRSDLIVWMRFHRNELFVVCFHHGSIRMEPACSRFHPDGASLFMKPHCSTSFRYYKDRPRSFYERFYHDLVEHSRRPIRPHFWNCLCCSRVWGSIQLLDPYRSVGP